MSRRRERRRRQSREAERAEEAGGPPGALRSVLGRAARGPAGAIGAVASRARSLAGRRWAPPALLLVFTLAVWARTFAVPVLGWDDNVYLDDARVKSISFGNARRILTESFFANYHPATTFTYALDRALWDEWAPGFHVLQLAFYAGGVVLLYCLFAAILKSRGAAFAGAAVYAAHAIHVEPVAWLAQRKDMVCLVFYAGAIIAYVRYARARESRWRPYALAVVLAALAMLSKGYAVVLPGAFIAYDLCFAERFRRRQVIDKLPFVILAAAVTVLTFLSQGEASALHKPGEIDITAWQRLTVLSKIFAVYVGRSLLPVRLCAKYIVGTGWLSGSVALVGAALAAGAVAGFLLLRRRLPAAAFGIALFVLPLATVMNVFFTLRIWIADRYLFFPTTGSSLALAAAGLWLYRRRGLAGGGRRAIKPAAAGLVVLYAALSVARIGVWTDPVLLWSDTLRKQLSLPGSGPLTASELLRLRKERGRPILIKDTQAFSALAGAYRRKGNTVEADALSGRLTKKGKGETPVDLDLARAEMAKGNYDKAVELLGPMAAGGTWVSAAALVVTGEALVKKGDLAAARDAFRRSLALYRKNRVHGAGAMLALGTLEFGERNFKEAADWYRRAREAVPESPRAAFNLGLALDALGEHAEAYGLLEKALALEAKSGKGSIDVADAHEQMGNTAYEKLGRFEDAARHFEKVLELKPDHPGRMRMEHRIRRCCLPRPKGP